MHRPRRAGVALWADLGGLWLDGYPISYRGSTNLLAPWLRLGNGWPIGSNCIRDRGCRIPASEFVALPRSNRDDLRAWRNRDRPAAVDGMARLPREVASELANCAFVEILDIKREDRCVHSIVRVRENECRRQTELAQVADLAVL